MPAYTSQIIPFVSMAGTLAIGVAGWFAKHSLDKRLEATKAQLDKEAKEHQVRFLKLHETRALIIAELYKLLAQVQWECTRYVGPTEWVSEEPLDLRLSETDRRHGREATFEAMVRCFRHLDSHRIYLPYETEQMMDQLLRQIWAQVEKASGFMRMAEIESLSVDYEEAHKTREQTLEYINTQFSQARRALEVELRQILGGAKSEVSETSPDF